MNRRTFFKAASATGLASGLSSPASFGYISEHNWEKYDWGNGPDVKDLIPGAIPAVWSGRSRSRQRRRDGHDSIEVDRAELRDGPHGLRLGGHQSPRTDLEGHPMNMAIEPDIAYQSRLLICRAVLAANGQLGATTNLGGGWDSNLPVTGQTRNLTGHSWQSQAF